MIRHTKDSGVEWLGKIPGNWSVSKYKYFANSRMGETILSSDTAEQQDEYNNIPIYSATQDDTVFGFMHKPNLLLKKNDFVIPARGNSIGCITMVKDDVATCTQTTICSRDIHDIDISYLYWCGCGLKDYWFKYDGSAIPQITVSQVNNNIVPIPPIEEQKRISAFLNKKCSEIDSAIVKTKSSIAQYIQLRRAMIANAVTKGIKKERTTKKSGMKWLETIPEEWESINPKALFVQRKDKAQAGEKQLTASQQYGVIYQDEYMELTGTKIVTVEKDFDILKHVEAGDFVISMRSFQGGLEYSEKSGSISSAYVMLIPNLDMVYPRFYKWLFKSSVYINALQSTSNLVRDGQAMRYSNFAQVRLYSVPLDEQKEIADYLDKKCAEIDTLIAKKTALLEEMETYKKSVIYEYVTGKKEV